MTHPIENPPRAPLVHHPSNVLDSFCRYGEEDQKWLAFSASITKQLQEYEAAHQHQMRFRDQSRRSR